MGQYAINARFRDAMRRYASGVCVVATSCGNARFASTLSTVSSLSLEPPALVFCINREASIHDPLVARGALSVNFLSAAQVGIARRCSGVDGVSGEGRFEGAAWRDTAEGIPILLDGTLAAVEGRIAERWVGGTHSVFMCVVEHVHQKPGTDACPLLYADGEYGSLHPLG
jgi:flavin reductase (DIM6/NTAB) family NADH-FMN oxidoreductase RutF